MLCLESRMCMASQYVQFSVSVKFVRSRLYISTDVCECFSLSLAVIFKVPLLMYAYCCYNICMYLLNSCCKCYLVVDGTTLVLTIPLGFSCPNGLWQYYSGSPPFAIQLSIPLWGLRSRGIKRRKATRLRLFFNEFI